MGTLSVGQLQSVVCFCGMTSDSPSRPQTEIRHWHPVIWGHSISSTVNHVNHGDSVAKKMWMNSSSGQFASAALLNVPQWLQLGTGTLLLMWVGTCYCMGRYLLPDYCSSFVLPVTWLFLRHMVVHVLSCNVVSCTSVFLVVGISFVNRRRTRGFDADMPVSIVMGNTPDRVQVQYRTLPEPVGP